MELSIIIPTFNRAALLRKTLLSIIGQNTDVLYEVIVVDNGSADGTKAACSELGPYLAHFTYHFDKEPGLLTGRHAGTALAAGGILSFIDDDVELNPRWIHAVTHLFNSRADVAIAGGPSLPKYHAYPPVWVSYFWQPTPYGGSMCLPLSLIDLGSKQLEVDPAYIFGLNYSIRKEALLGLGGFHPDCIPAHLQQYQGDGETGLSIKAKNKKMKALFSDTAFLYHQVVPERMTYAYFNNWFYYNGVCNSFTNIRLTHQLYDAEPVTSHAGRLVHRLKRFPAQLFQSIAGKVLPRLPDDIIKLQQGFDESFRKGFLFHQHAFSTDEAVKSWVLRPDYWNYRLPS